MSLKETVTAGLKEGLGAEDIAVRNNLSLRAVQIAVAVLRASGALKKIYRGDKA